MMEHIIASIKGTSQAQAEMAFAQFIIENKLAGEFLVWIEKWKHIHNVPTIYQ